MTSLSWFAAGLGIGVLLTALIGWSGRMVMRTLERDRDAWKLMAKAEERRADYWQRQALSPHPLNSAVVPGSDFGAMVAGLPEVPE